MEPSASVRSIWLLWSPNSKSALGVDPFSKIVSITSVRSVDDLVEAYLKAYLPQQPEDQDEDLLEAARRARGRRARQGA